MDEEYDQHMNYLMEMAELSTLRYRETKEIS